ncbi:uncharacterized protein LOC134263591 [Saccostrea cucullata]|uniref:uncharacterized protein LOC134263591 n=1 Tax=Saccostrea cuccullata TaxID=36930 RepID=UPI002ED15C6E
MDQLHEALPSECNLGQYIREDRCFCTQFPLEALTDLEDILVRIAKDKKWKENIPHEWVFLNDEISNTKREQRIMSVNDILEGMPVNNSSRVHAANDMLRYYHDAGKVLFFNEAELNKYAIIDVQWFVDAFKTIITDEKHVQGVIASGKDWQEYYSTGHIQDSLLTEIWRKEDENLLTSLKEENISVNDELDKDARFLLYHKQTLLMYMQRLGLMSIGETSHYIPCMNKKNFGEEQKHVIITSSSKSSILVFSFDFLPYFLFYRLVVKIMEIKHWRALKSNNISCLYKDAAMFTYKNHNIAVAVTDTTIQLQIFHPEQGIEMSKNVTLSVRSCIENIMKDISSTFHKNLAYRIGYTCDNEREQILGMKVTESFIEEKDLPVGDRITCPQHQVENLHHINPDYISSFWR